MASYRATFQRAGESIRTRRYPTSEAAQDALMRRPGVGSFRHLGRVSGDAHEAGRPCEYAPRNGGAVSIDERSDATDWYVRASVIEARLCS